MNTFKTAIAGVILTITALGLSACGDNARTAHMSCADLWHDNLTMGDPLQPDSQPYDLDRVRQNNKRLVELDCGMPPIG